MMPSETNKLQRQADRIQYYLSRTTEPYDDWDWDGDELVVWLDNEPIERYQRADLSQIIKGFDYETI
jgi:hypothetical protein